MGSQYKSLCDNNLFYVGVVCSSFNNSISLHRFDVINFIYDYFTSLIHFGWYLKKFVMKIILTRVP